ncbi:hypothetical protein NKJ26_22120 [Mesorhizobium sp. M0152]|uniref:hypothetical protein n=1 Tax=Mesorhizobium sp. M0152 TaxID=2956898 RepID=UPI0033381984
MALADTSARSVAPADISAVMEMFEPTNVPNPETGFYVRWAGVRLFPPTMDAAADISSGKTGWP